MRRYWIAVIASSLIGGIAGASLVRSIDRGGWPVPSASTATAQVVSGSRFELVDARGKTRAILAMSPDGGPGLFFFDTAGRNRLVLGLYSPAESESPSVVLNDREGRAAGIFRLYGGKETPVVVLKHDGRDRSIYGLNAGSTEPFLANIANDGKKTTAFGSY